MNYQSDETYETTINNTSPLVAYSRGLHHYNSPDIQFTITFQGCCIELYGLYANAAYNVSLDGETPVPTQGMNTVPDASGLWYPDTLLYKVNGLSDSIHVNHTLLVNALATTTGSQGSFPFNYAKVKSASIMSKADKHLLSRQSGTSYSTSPHHISVVIGLSVGAFVLLSILGLALFLLYRGRRKHRTLLGLNLSEEVDPPAKSTSAPVPWVLLRSAHRAAPSSSTWRLSSVISGWRRLSRDQTESVAPTTPGSRSLSGATASFTTRNQSSTSGAASTSSPSRSSPQLHLTIANP